MRESDVSDEIVVRLSVAKPVRVRECHQKISSIIQHFPNPVRKSTANYSLTPPTFPRFCRDNSFEVAALPPGTALIVQRGDCMFEHKAINAQKVGAVAVIVVDNDSTTDSDTNTAPFAMSAAEPTENVPTLGGMPINVVSVFLHGKQGTSVMSANARNPGLLVRIGTVTRKPALLFADWLRRAGPFAPTAIDPKSTCDAKSTLSRPKRPSDEVETITMAVDPDTGVTCSTELNAAGDKISHTCFDENGNTIEEQSVSMSIIGSRQPKSILETSESDAAIWDDGISSGQPDESVIVGEEDEKV